MSAPDVSPREQLLERAAMLVELYVERANDIEADPELASDGTFDAAGVLRQSADLIRRLAEALRVESAPPAGPDGATERFERLAAEFYDDTRLLAPGKSVAMETWTQSYEDDRQAAWKIWIAARRRGLSSPPEGNR